MRSPLAAILTSAVLAVSTAAVAQTPPTIAVGQSIDGFIDRMTGLTPDGTGRWRCYIYNSKAGEAVTAVLSARTFAPKLSVGRGANCATASFQMVQRGAEGGEARIAFKAGGGRYVLMAEGPQNKIGNYTLQLRSNSEPAPVSEPEQVGDAARATLSRRELMDRQVSQHRAQAAAEEARRRAIAEEQARLAEQQRLQAEAEQARAAALAAQRQAEEEAEEDYTPAPQPNFYMSMLNNAQQIYEQNRADQARQQAFLNDVARSTQAIAAAKQREELARQAEARRAAAERAELAAAQARSQQAAQALAQQQALERQRRAAEEQQRRLAEQRATEQRLAQQRQADQQRLAQLQQSSTTAPQRPAVNATSPRPATSAGTASTNEDPRRCVASPQVSQGALCGKGTLNISTTNGCPQPVDIRLCLKKQDGRWDCGMQWGVQPQQRFSHAICQATSESFMAVRSAGSSARMDSPN